MSGSNQDVYKLLQSHKLQNTLKFEVVLHQYGGVVILPCAKS